MSLIGCVAEAIRGMHEAGLQHNDLGNQNILLRRVGKGEWEDVQFIDLNRARRWDGLTLRQRARDLSRIALPSDLLRVFIEMYCGDEPPPRRLLQWERIYRRLYAVHSATRPYRHPVRERRHRVSGPREPATLPEKEMWIWDEKSGQAVSTMRPRDRIRYYPLSRHFRIVGATLPALYPVWREYRALLRECYSTPVGMAGRVGVAINPASDTVDRQLALLDKLGRPPVMLRFYHHEPAERWAFLAEIVRHLHRAGTPVSIALVQDRRAVRDPAQWQRFVTRVLRQVAGSVERVEVGHAVNRVKWGIWGFMEHRRLLEAAQATVREFPELRFMGPAVMDFDYPFLLAALAGVPDGLRLAALSHHLYVDRRGAPENRQGRFSSLEKFAMARAIARWSDRCEDRLVVSEVNWPLEGTGVYSPVGSPYESPGPRFNDPSVSEDKYADYMIRYLVIGLCSGMVDRIFWWRLVSRGFGLVDDTQDENWRERPAFRMLRQFLSMLGESRFVGKAGGGGPELFTFECSDGRRVCLAYSRRDGVPWKLPPNTSEVLDAFGDPLDAGKEVCLSGRPVYAGITR